MPIVLTVVTLVAIQIKQIKIKPYAYAKAGERNTIGTVDMEYIHYNFEDEGRFSGIHGRTKGRHKSQAEGLLRSLVEKYGKGYEYKFYEEYNSDAWIWTLEGADVSLTYNRQTNVTDLYMVLNSPEYQMRRQKKKEAMRKKKDSQKSAVQDIMQ